MKLFNAFQLVILFVCFPFIIGWLHTKPFPYSAAIFWIAIVAYILEFGFVVAAMRDLLDLEDKR